MRGEHRRSCCWDYPRIRGEHLAGTGLLCTAVGSSPHARGAPCCKPSRINFSGIIPACAGSTGGSGYVGDFTRDHPRMRGGAQRRARREEGREGIIPACAGSTVRAAKARAVSRDHPRMRGEHFFALLLGLG